MSLTPEFLSSSQLDFKNNEYLSYEWLRENCRCTACYNTTTNQRNIQLYNIPENVKPQSQCISESALKITWSDGHESIYTVDWLRRQRQCEERPEEVLWSGDMTDRVAEVTATQVRSQHGITQLTQSLLQYGVGLVTNVEPSLKGTQEIVECLGPPQQTIFGNMWQFSDQMEHADTAYTNLGLDVHTDTTYFIEPAGLIIFHCIQRECEGGKTALVDGFKAAHEMKIEAPDLYQTLATVRTEFQYVDSQQEHYLSAFTPMLQHSGDDRLSQIRYNLYDRSSRVPQPESATAMFYRALRSLTSAVRRPEAVWWLTLQPGTTVFVNNWRVMHGRSAYTGRRVMTGAYMTMGSLLSKARGLRLIR